MQAGQTLNTGTVTLAATMTPAAATQPVLWGGLVIGLVLGALAQASRFCTMGALTDWFSYGGTARLMMWLLAVAAAATGAHALIGIGWLDATRALPWSNQLLWLSCLVGGVLFGVGMVLASGCPQRNLVRLGAGSLKALVTLGVAAFAADITLRGILALPRVRVLDASGAALAGPQDLASLFAAATGIAADPLRWTLVALFVLALLVLVWRQRVGLDRLQVIAGIGIGLTVVMAWALTGHFGFLPEHPETLEPAWLGTASRRPEGLSFAAPLAHAMQLLTLWSDANTKVSFGVMVALGVPLGSLVSALLRREFRVEGFAGTQDLGDHLIGGVLMGFGGVTALGCSIGQGLSGLSLLSAGAVIAVGGMVAGTRLGLWFQVWRLERVA